MSKHTTSDAKNIYFHFWLVFSSGGDVRVARVEPSCDRTEHKMKMLATLPKALWQQPVLRGEITISTPDNKPVQIDVGAASEALRSALGVDVDFKIIPPEDE